MLEEVLIAAGPSDGRMAWMGLSNKFTRTQPFTGGRVLWRLVAWMLYVFLMTTMPAWSQGQREFVDVLTATVEPVDLNDGIGWQINADFDVHLTDHLEDTLNRGVPLYFVVDFQALRRRWYWFDETVVYVSRTYRLSYHALTRQYRVSSGGLIQNFSSLEDAKSLISTLRSWKITDKALFKPSQVYQLGVRLRLDVGQMPKPFQVNAMINRDWILQSEWYRFTLTPNELSR